MKISLSRFQSVLVINLKGGAARPPISPIGCQKPTPGLHEPPGRKAPLRLIGQGVLSFRRSREASLSGKPATLDGAHTARNPQRMGFCAPVSRAYRRLPCVAVPHAPNPRSVEAPPLPPAAWLAPHGRRLTLTLGRRVMGTFISSAYTLRTVQQVSALVPLTGGWMPQPGHPIPSAALRGGSYSMPMFLRPFFNPQRPNPALVRTGLTARRTAKRWAS